MTQAADVQTPSVLLLTSYPIVDPKHGGQIRAAELVKQYQGCGWIVENVAFVDRASNEARGANDRDFFDSRFYNRFDGQQVRFVNDLQLSAYVSSNEVFKAFVLSMERQFDVIHVEQPWLWPLAERYKTEVNRHCLLIYGSQNIEAPLKIEILTSATDGEFSALYRRIYSSIEHLEKRAAKNADIVVAVSRSDLDTVVGWGSEAKFVLAPNGVRSVSPDPTQVMKWRERVGEFPFLLYVASAHPPNYTGFSRILGGSLACFPPDTRLVVAGSVCPHIEVQSRIGPFRDVNSSRLNLVHQISDCDLSALKSLTHGYFLPVAYGGGTNLKTAEALHSGKVVVGTNAAFRGFEGWSSFPNVFIGGTPGELHAAIRGAFHMTAAPRVDAGKRDELEWASSFKDLIEEIKSSLKEKRHGSLD